MPAKSLFPDKVLLHIPEIKTCMCLGSLFGYHAARSQLTSVLSLGILRYDLLFVRTGIFYLFYWILMKELISHSHAKQSCCCTSQALTQTLISGGEVRGLARRQGWDVDIHMNHTSFVIWLNKLVNNKNGLVAGQK